MLDGSLFEGSYLQLSSHTHSYLDLRLTNGCVPNSWSGRICGYVMALGLAGLRVVRF